MAEAGSTEEIRADLEPGTLDEGIQKELSLNLGYIKLSRNMLEWEWWDDHETFRLFIYLLIAANWEDKSWHGVKVPRGSLITSRSNLAHKTGLSERQVRTAINHLKMTGEVTIQATKQWTMINIVNYAKYQDKPTSSDRAKDQAPTKRRPSTDQRATTTKEHKEHKEVITNDRFEEFWRLYPKKVGKPAAEKSFSRICKNDETYNLIITGLQKVKELDWSKRSEDEKRFIPYPATWLNQERWNDEVQPQSQKKKPWHREDVLPDYMTEHQDDELPF